MFQKKKRNIQIRETQLSKRERKLVQTRLKAFN